MLFYFCVAKRCHRRVETVEFQFYYNDCFLVNWQACRDCWEIDFVKCNENQENDYKQENFVDKFKYIQM